MEKNTAFYHDAFELLDATTELRLHMEALQALYWLIERAYFESSAEDFVKFFTVQQWDEIQLNLYNFTGIVDSVMKECRTVEDLAERYYKQYAKAQHTKNCTRN